MPNGRCGNDVWQEKRQKVFLRDNGHCRFCKRPCNPEDFTVDHILPRAKGGTDRNANLALACYKCNQKKRDELALSTRRGKIVRRALVDGRWKFEVS